MYNWGTTIKPNRSVWWALNNNTIHYPQLDKA